MRRSNFFTAALVALLTFIALSAFVGRRYGRWRHDHCYYDGRYRDRYDDRGYRDRYDDRNAPSRDRQPQDSTFTK